MSDTLGPFGPTPPRAPNSVRRTTTIDTLWPEGHGRPMAMAGKARDLLTKTDGSAIILAGAAFELLASPQREILALATEPPVPAAATLVGVRAGGASRAALVERMGDYAGHPLYQLVDDFPGASLVAGWIWSRWVPNWREKMREAAVAAGAGANRRGAMEGVCHGFSPGSSALNADGTGNPAQNPQPVGPLTAGDDPIGWHELAVQSGVAFRRARRLDLSRENDMLRAELHFQDSGPAPEGGRIAIHEYTATAMIDPESMTLVSLESRPHILPYSACRGAVAKAQRMVGQPITNFRAAVLETLPGTWGCTHLNDVLRMLADVPALSDALP